MGGKNYRTYFEAVRYCLKHDGLSLLHAIGSNGALPQADPWIEKYILPHSMIPATSRVTDALENRFVVEDWHNSGTDCDRTLSTWNANFEAAWPALSANYDGRFQRMWRDDLAVSAAIFRRRDPFWQLALSPHGVAGCYRVPRQLGHRATLRSQRRRRIVQTSSRGGESR